jgi:geranylgeranyl transferase type-2 subunit beta
MGSSLYLDTLDALLRQGMKNASGDFVASQTRFVLDQQQDDGGFRGPLGGSDLYYTDFALRCLALLAREPAAFARARAFLDSCPREPASIVDCFSLLNAYRVMDAGHEGTKAGVRKCLDAHRQPQGGFSRFRGDGPTSAYQTFLGSLCFQMLGDDLPPNANVAIQDLWRPEGGYAEFAGQRAAQTNATAAATALLVMQDAMTDERKTSVAAFLAKMQRPDGGLAAHADMPGGDLLSTFTGMLTLAGIGAIAALDAAAVARFLKRTAAPQGGFAACVGGHSPDAEYTYYGLAVFSLLKQAAPQT